MSPHLNVGFKHIGVVSHLSVILALSDILNQELAIHVSVQHPRLHPIDK